MQLHAARIFVGDLGEAHDFYGLVLGLPLRAGGPQDGFCVYAAGHCQLVVEPVPPDASENDRALVGRFTGLSFDVANIEARYRALVDKGVRFEGPPERQFWGGTLATFRDPAGNTLQLVQLPASP